MKNETNEIPLLTCKKCGWVHFPMTMEECEASIKQFNDYFDRLSEYQQKEYYGGRKSSLDRYAHCFNCGGDYTNFRPSEPNDCPDGCTIQPILKANV